MGDQSSIEWTDATWNPMTGCTKVSPGCGHCYMFRQYPRLAGMGVKGYAGGQADQIRFWPDRLDQPSHWKRPRMIFVNSMSDTFHSDMADETIAQVFDAMRAAPQHTYQVLTKRPNRVSRWWDWYSESRAQLETVTARFEVGWVPIEWPANIWLGTSVESDLYLDRIERIAGIAPVTFLSAEPLLGPLTMLHAYIAQLDWVIVGGESGPNARPMLEEWAYDIWKDCDRNGVPFFFKQWGGINPNSRGRLLSGRTYDEMPTVLTRQAVLR